MQTEFTWSAPPALPAAPAAEAAAPGGIASRLQSRHGLWVDPFTARYIARCVDRGVAQVEFIAADARTGRSAFWTMPGGDLRG
jgi:hypothetical protein